MQCVGHALQISPMLRCSTPLGSFLFLRVCVRQNCVCVCVSVYYLYLPMHQWIIISNKRSRASLGVC